jgi:predicted ester cyclase
MSEEESKAASRRVLEAFNAQDFDALREACNEDVAELLKGWIDALPFDDHHIEIEEVIAEGGLVVTTVTTTGVHAREFEGLPPTGKSFTNHGAILCRVEAGRVAEVRPFFDDLNIVRHFGATITPQ